MWNPFANAAAIGRARQVANLHKVRAQELEGALKDLVAHFDAMPVAINYTPSTQGKAVLKETGSVAVRIPFLADPGSPIVLAVRDAKEVLG